MSLAAKCRDCGAPIPGGGVEELCGKCLLGLALEGKNDPKDECTGWESEPGGYEERPSASEQAAAPEGEAPAR